MSPFSCARRRRPLSSIRPKVTAWGDVNASIRRGIDRIEAALGSAQTRSTSARPPLQCHNGRALAVAFELLRHCSRSFAPSQQGLYLALAALTLARPHAHPSDDASPSHTVGRREPRDFPLGAPLCPTPAPPSRALRKDVIHHEVGQDVLAHLLRHSPITADLCHHRHQGSRRPSHSTTRDPLARRTSPQKCSNRLARASNPDDNDARRADDTGRPGRPRSG